MNYKQILYDFFNSNRGEIEFSKSFQIIISLIFLKQNHFQKLDKQQDNKEDYELEKYSERLIKNIDKNSIESFQEKILKLENNEIKNLILDIVFDEKYNYPLLGHTSSKYICDLVFNLMNIKENDSILDLGSGIGKFIVSANLNSEIQNLKKIRFMGIEISFDKYILSKMIMSILDIENYITNEDFSIKEIPEFDKAYIYPPIGIKVNKNIIDNFLLENKDIDARISSEWIYIDRLIRNLKENGKVISLVHPKVLYSNHDYEYRKKIIKEGLLEGIIQLPSNSLVDTSIPMVLLIFSKNNKYIKIIDANKSIEECDKTNNKELNLPIDKILDIYNSEFVNKKSIEEISILKDIQVKKLLADKPVVPNPVILSKVARVFSGSQYSIKKFRHSISQKATNCKILTSTNIQDGSIEWDFLPYIDYKESKFDKFALRKNDVLISSKSSKYKIVVVDIEPEEKTLVIGGIIIIRPDIEKINPYYLKMFLESKSGEQIIEYIQRGINITIINPKDLSSIEVSCPNIEIQNFYGNKFKSKIESLSNLKNRIKRLEKEISEYYDSKVII